MTTFLPHIVSAAPGVYAPQADSLLLIEAMETEVRDRTVLDVCTGSGVVAIAAAHLGARTVSAVDICRRAVRCARRNADDAGVPVDVRAGDWVDASRRGPYDVVVSNPPYVPKEPGAKPDSVPKSAGPAHAWDAGPDGRLVLDPLCAAAPNLLSAGGVMFLVQSEFADPQRSLRLLGRRLHAEVVLTRTIPFGPVLNSRAEWMERAGLLSPGCREEEIIVIRAEKR